MAFNLNLDRCLCRDSSDCSDCRLWLLVGSDRQTDRQCQLLSCPGQLKRLMALALYSPPLRLDWKFYVANFLPLTVVWVNNSAWGVGSVGKGEHPVLKRQDRLGKEPFAGFGTVVEDITGSGYTKNQPILLGAFWENAFFVFLHYKIKQKTSQNRAKMPLNLTSEGLKYPPEVGLQHETCSTICGTHVQVILNHKNLTGIGRGGQERSK